MTTSSIVRERPWRLDRKAVLIHAPDLDNVGCLAHVNVSYDQTQREGYITIKINLKLAGITDDYRTIHLNILPRAITTCSVIPSSFKNMLPNKLLAKLKGVKEVSAVTTLSLQLKEPSVVLVPPGLTYPISPAESGDGDFYAISRISQATSIRLHYCKQDFPKSDQLRLRTFERNWTVFTSRPHYPPTIKSSCLRPFLESVREVRVRPLIQSHVLLAPPNHHGPPLKSALPSKSICLLR